MKRLGSATLLTFSLIASAAACDSGDGDTTDDTASTSEDGGDGDTGTTGTTETGGDGDGGTSDTGTDSGAMAVGTVMGVVSAADGTPYETPGGQLCGPIEGKNLGACVNIEENADGSFAQDFYATGVYNLKWVHPNGDAAPYYSTVIQQVVLEEGDTTIDQSWVIPEITTVVDLSEGMPAADLDMGDGLTLSVDPAAMDWGFLDPSQAGGTPIPSDQWRYQDVNGENVLGIWAMLPFGGKVEASDGTMSFTLDNALGLEANAAVNFYEIEKDTGEIQAITTGTVNAEGTAIVPDGGIHTMTWLVATAG
jgi:hypothetical protein